MYTDEEFSRLIPDEGIRSYLIGSLGSEPFGNNLNYYTIFGNILNLAFMYAFSCYVDIRNRNFSTRERAGVLERCVRNGNANSLRVIRTLEKVYAEYPITNELIQFVLTDIQFDFMLGEESKLMEYFPGCYAVTQFKLGEFFSMVNLSIVSSRLGQHDLDTLDKKLHELIALFPFLRETKLVFSEKAGWYVFEISPCEVFPDGTVNTYGLIHRFKTGKRCRFYYLASLEKTVVRYEDSRASQNAVFSEMPCMGSRAEISSPYMLPWDAETVYSYLNPKLPETPEAVQHRPGFEQIFNINYKYVKNLALAISDALGRETFKQCGEALVNTFRHTYPDAFVYYQKGSGNWDAVVVMLLIEASPSRVLQTVLLANPNIAFPILRNLRHRLGKEFSEKLVSIQSNDDFTERAEQLIDYRQLRFGDRLVRTRSYVNMRAELLAEAKADIIMSALLYSHDERRVRYAGGIGQEVESLEQLPADIPPAELCQAIRNTLGETLKHICCFYAGVLGYGEKKIEYDKKSEWQIMPANEIRRFQDDCRKGFEAAARKEWKIVRGLDDEILELLRNFLALCRLCRDGSDTFFGRSNESRWLYTVLGRYEIMDLELFSTEVDVDAVEELSEKNAVWWRQKAIRIMRFFATGSFDPTEDSTQYFQNAILPAVASFYSFNSSKDGYDTASLFLTIDVNRDNVDDYHRKVNVLSEFSYDMHSMYYCLPNVIRSNRKWWIEPFIIECKLLDDIYKDESQKEE